ncbi:MAG: hypothetical protein JST23_00340 [Bacteroidetes bacterium]|nr:hypothetical protein [Bacteroidota bacterium]
MKIASFFLLFITLTLSAFAQRPSKEQMEADKKRFAEAQKKYQDQLNKMDPKARQKFDSMMNALGANKAKDDAIRQVNENKTAKPKTSVGLAKNQSTDIPENQMAILNGAPKITNAIQYEAYLNRLKSEVSAKVNPAIRSSVDFLINNNKNNQTQLNNIPVLYFMQQDIEAAVYASLCVAIINKSVPVSQANITAILSQAGYPQYAIPLLEYLNTQFKSDLLLSNTGQAYLSLGDKGKAKTCFMRALAVNSDNVSANCGMGFIEANSPNPSAAAPYIEKVMKNSYSEMLEKLVNKKNIKLNYKNMRVKVPEVFSPRKYKVAPCAFSFEEVEETMSKRLQIHYAEEDWVRKLQKANDDFDKATAKMDNNQRLALWGGLISNGVMQKKAKFMSMQADLYINDFVKRITPEYNTLRLKVANLENDLKDQTKKIRSDIPDSYEACKAQKEALNEYLKKSTELVNDFVTLNIYDFYDYADQHLYWDRFLYDETMYNQKFYQYAQGLLKAVDDYSSIQLLNEAHSVVYNCAKQIAAKKPNINTDEKPDRCPFSAKISVGIGAFKADCRGWSLEGGEIVIGSLAKNYKTGEFTLGVGMGGNLEAPFLGGSAGAQMVITVGSDFIPSDLGVVASAGVEAAAGPIVIGTENISATMSIANGVSVDAIHDGQEVKLFNLSPKN